MSEYVSELTDWHTYQLIPAYPSGLTDRPIYLSIWSYWPTNKPDYPAWLTDQHTRSPIWADWLTNIPDYLPLLKFVYCQCVVSGLPVHAYYPPSYKDWLTSAYLSSYLPTYQGQLTDQHPVTYVYIFGLTAFQSDWPSCLCSYPAYLSGLTTDIHICRPIWADSETFLPSFLALHIKAD